MLIRREQPADVQAIHAVHAVAFEPQATGQVPVEAGLVDALRAADGWLPALSLVACEPGDGVVVGHVVCTRGSVSGRPALGLGPLGVLPELQGKGVGGALMHAVLGAAEALGEPLVVLLGHTGYYPRFGFRPAAELGITPPDPAWGSTSRRVRSRRTTRRCVASSRTRRRSASSSPATRRCSPRRR